MLTAVAALAPRGVYVCGPAPSRADWARPPTPPRTRRKSARREHNLLLGPDCHRRQGEPPARPRPVPSRCARASGLALGQHHGRLCTRGGRLGDGRPGLLLHRRVRQDVVGGASGAARGDGAAVHLGRKGTRHARSDASQPPLRLPTPALPPAASHTSVGAPPAAPPPSPFAQAGIVCSLSARTAVLAAANPVGGNSGIR